MLVERTWQAWWSVGTDGKSERDKQFHAVNTHWWGCLDMTDVNLLVFSEWKRNIHGIQREVFKEKSKMGKRKASRNDSNWKDYLHWTYKTDLIMGWYSCKISKEGMSMAEPIPLQVYNWSEFVFSLHRWVAATKLKNWICPNIYVYQKEKRWIHVFFKGINAQVKHKQLSPAFQLGFLCLFQQRITL